MKINKEKLKRGIIIGVFAAALAVSLYFVSDILTVFAAEAEKVDVSTVSYTSLAPLPLGKGGEILTTYTLSSYLSGMLRLIIALGGAVAVLMAIIGGVQYVAFGIAPSAKNDAKDRIENAFIGLAIVLTSYLLLNTISPDLVNFKLMLPPVAGTHQSVQSVNGYLEGFNTCGGLENIPCEAGYVCKANTPVGETMFGTCIPATACGPDLSPIKDPEAVRMESHEKVIWTSSNKDVQRNLNKLKQETDEFIAYIAKKGGTVTVNSAYRPLAYQAHLYEVFKRWNQIKNNDNPECVALKEEIRREFQKHELGGAVSPPDGCAPHVKGTGIDLTVKGITYFPNNTELASKGIEISWQDVKNDPWHYNLTNPPFSGCAE